MEPTRRSGREEVTYGCPEALAKKNNSKEVGTREEAKELEQERASPSRAPEKIVRRRRNSLRRRRSAAAPIEGVRHGCEKEARDETRKEAGGG